MKIAWFSPLPPQRSGIADYSAHLLRHLRARAEVHLWVDGVMPANDLTALFPVTDYSNRAATLPLLRMYDAVVYNMGNNIEFHLGMYEVMRDFPGIVILHDYFLANFYAGYWLGLKKNWDFYRAQFNTSESDELIALFNEYFYDSEGRSFPMDKLFQHPMNDDVVKHSRGVVVHSEFARGLLAKRGCRKVVHLNQPAYPVPYRARYRTRDELDLPKDKCLLLSLGHLNANKRMHKVLEAIAQSAYLRENVYYVMVGPPSPFDLEAIVRQHGLTDQVKMVGYAPLDEMYDYLHVADVCLNLRYPTMGETSASLIRMLALGKASVVTDVGWYGELPDECVAKVSPEREVGEIGDVLTKLVADPEWRARLGRSGQHLIDTHFTAPQFVDGLLRFAQSLPPVGVEPGRILSEILQSVTDTVAPLGLDSALERVARELEWAKD